MAGADPQVHPGIDEVIRRWDEKDHFFDEDDLSREILGAWKQSESSEPGLIAGFQADYWPFVFQPSRDGGESGFWGGYFNPLIIQKTEDGQEHGSPDLEALSDFACATWRSRVSHCRHPTIKGRYHDLLWDVACSLKTSVPNIEDALAAVDCYLAAVDLPVDCEDQDDPVEGNRTIEKSVILRRACYLSTKVGNPDRIESSFAKALDFVQSTFKINLVGTYSYLFDICLSKKSIKKCPSSVREESVKFFERILETMFTEEGDWATRSYQVQQIQGRMVDFYRRKQDQVAVEALERKMARLFEQHAAISPSAIHKVHFLEVAEAIYSRAGLVSEAKRVRASVEVVAPEIKSEMAPIRTEIRITQDEIDQVNKSFESSTLERSIATFAIHHVVRKSEVVEHLKTVAESAPIQHLLSRSVTGERGTVARVGGGDSMEDDDLVYHAAQIIGMDVYWLQKGVEHLQGMGMSQVKLTEYCCASPIFKNSRHSLISKGIQEFFAGNWSTSIHLLVPQIEYAIVGQLEASGHPTTRIDRSGRAYAVQRGLGEALADPAMLDIFGMDVQFFLTAVLAHPKGLNIRNSVAHGLWDADAFGEHAALRIIHVMMLLGIPGVETESGCANPTNPSP